MPIAVARYIPANSARSTGPTACCQSRTTATPKAMNGMTTAVRLAARSTRDMVLEDFLKSLSLLRTMTTKNEHDVVRSHKRGGRAPWATLDPALGAALRATLPSLVEEVLDAVRANVPAYAAPLEGAFGRTVRIGVEQA